MTKKKKGRPLPQWLQELPPGEYTLPKLCALIGRDRSSTRKVMDRHCAKRQEWKEKPMNVYLWTGKSVQEEE